MERAPLTGYAPETQWFRHNPTGIHGISHVTRVLFWADHLASLIAGPDSLRLPELRWAAVCHDVARENDGRDPEHGMRAAAWVREQLPLLRPAATAHVNLDLVAELCYWHLPPDRVTPRMTTELMILKDADALDRIRLGPYDLDPTRLRLARSHDLIEPAARLFEATGLGPGVDATSVLQAATALNLST